ncbi:MAG TPA: metallophosphoesterase [Terriglobia bacterium]|nr:metallophosphoesterase [Terriglobia bacterium]
MGFRTSLLVALLLLNAFAYLAMRRAVEHWVREAARRRVMLALHLGFLLLNLPLAVFFFRELNAALLRVPTAVLEVVFYPSTAWLTTLIAFFLLAGPIAAIWGLVQLGERGWRRLRSRAGLGNVGSAPDLSRRGFLAGSAGLLVPGIYAVAAYGAYGSLNDLDISEQRDIVMPRLPRSLDGMTIVQLTDLHVGPYIRERELRALVGEVNSLRPDLVVITGDILDWELASLPEAVSGLRGIESTLGVFAVLGNHDIYADRYSYAGPHRGGVKIADGLQTIGIRTLRNEVVEIGEGPERLALLGLDWLNPNPSSPNFYRYQQAETRKVLGVLSQQAGAERAKLLLAHHPDTFGDAIPFGIDLTLSGHTHGGGQVLLGTWRGIPLGIGLVRFKYLSGLYQEQGLSLYVNRGIGYLGVPIRINCPPEISRFRLTSQAA